MTFAAEHLREYPARKVCRILRIPRSSYYHARKYGRQRKAYEAEQIQAVQNMFTEHQGNFGRRMLKNLLAQSGVHISEHKISRIMKQLGLESKYGRRKCKNVHTSENTERYIHENLFMRMSRDAIRGMNIWSMDFTEIKIAGKKIYICGIISVNSRVLVGYAWSYKCTAALAVETVKKAIAAYGVPDMITTDRGAQFTSKDFFDTMESFGIKHSMSRPHKPIDNRYIETFWKTMKVELGQVHKLKNITVEMFYMIVDYYIYYYNNLRPHSSLHYQPPLAA